MAGLKSLSLIMGREIVTAEFYGSMRLRPTAARVLQYLYKAGYEPKVKRCEDGELTVRIK